MADHPATAPDETPRGPLQLSQLLGQLLRKGTHHSLTLEDICHHLQDRAWGGMLLVLGLINFIAPPGTTVITGMPLVIVATQMMMGRDQPWFPAKIRHRPITKASLQTVLTKLLPWERRLETLLRPRMPRLTSHRGTRLLGAIATLLAIIIWLPIPFGNHIPSLAIILMAIGLLTRDGRVVIAGYIVTIIALCVIALVAGTTAMIFVTLYHQFAPLLMGAVAR